MNAFVPTIKNLIKFITQTISAIWMIFLFAFLFFLTKKNTIKLNIFFVLLSWYKRTKKSSRWLFFNSLHSWNTPRLRCISAISASYFTVPSFKFASLYQNKRRQEKKKTNLFFKMKACIREWLYWTKTWVPLGSSIEITERVKS